MRAMAYSRYGSPDVLHIEEVPPPVPRKDHVLVAVRATSVNAADLDQLAGSFMVRFGSPRRPLYPIPGSDISGVVEAVGPDVTEFRPGDEVFADLTTHGFGAFAELVTVPQGALVLKPGNLTFEQSAAVPSAGGVALKNLHAKRPIRPGDRVLINGAGGGMGSFAIQIAKSEGAEVTGVDRPSKESAIRSLGADHFIDFRCKDFRDNRNCYDLVLDLAAHRTLFSSLRAVRPHGAYVLVGGSITAMLQSVFLGPVISAIGSKRAGIVYSYPGRTDLLALKEAIESGKVLPLIDRTYSLSEAPDAIRYLASGEVTGKVVISVSGDSTR